jgi:hypothetical protein
VRVRRGEYRRVEEKKGKVRKRADVPLHVVSHGSVPMCPRLVQCHSGLSEGGDWKLMTFGESTSRKLLDRRVWKLSALGVVPGDSTEEGGNTYEQGGSRRGGKEMDRCPLTLHL